MLLTQSLKLLTINYTIELAFIWENNTDNHIKQNVAERPKIISCLSITFPL